MELFVVENDNSYKLELGTKTMNVLFTSTLRIDKNRPPAVGPSSTNGLHVGNNTMIFVLRSFVEWYGKLQQQGFNSISIRELYPFDEFAQLRQLRSNRPLTNLANKMSPSLITAHFHHRYNSPY